jgi:hypothetical protein
MINKLIISFFLFVACSNEPQETRSQSVTNKDTVGFVTDLPLDKHGKADFFERIKWERDYIGGLDTLEKGYAPLQIRLWYVYGDDDINDRQIVVIKKKKDWLAELHTTTWAYTDTSGYMTGRTVITAKPKMGWDKFIDSLKSLGVMELPDQSRIPDMPLTVHASTIHVEIAQEKKYRFYSYTAPKKYAGKFTEAARIEKIMQLIEDELGFKRIRVI